MRKYRSFLAEATRQEEFATRVPDGFPEHLSSPLAWTRAEVENKRSNWIVELGKDDIDALEAALTSFEGKKAS
jgi:hypothetical protein